MAAIIDDRVFQAMRWYAGHGPAVTAILPIRSSRQCVVGYLDGSISVYNNETSLEEVIVKGHTKAVRKLLYDEEKRYVTSISEDGFVKLWEIVVGVTGCAEGQDLGREGSGAPDAFTRFSFHEDEVSSSKKSHFGMNLLKSYQVEGMELIDIVKLKNGVMMTAGVSSLKK